MVVEGPIFAIRADNVATSNFILLCISEKQEEADPDKPFVYDFGHVINYGTKYVTGKYLNLVNYNDKYHEFEMTKKLMLLCYYVWEIFFPQIPLIKFLKKSLESAMSLF